jgi:ATP-dependent RNA helicase DeaD
VARDPTEPDMPSFEDLGLRPELLRALEDQELEQPTALQEAVIPALRRGGNLVARASAGSGKTLAYTLGTLDRLTARDEEAETVLRLLVLVPTAAEAERVALEIFPFAQAAGLAVTVGGGAWGTEMADAEIVVSPVAEIAKAVRGSSLKLESLEAVVIDGAGVIAELGDWERVDALLELAPRDAQRIVVSAAIPAPVEDLIERRVKRALRYPSEAALPEERNAPLEGRIGYVLVSAAEKVEILARQLAPREEPGAPPVIFCRNDDRAAELAEQLAVRGFAVGGADDADADVAIAASDTTREELVDEAEAELGQTVSFDVPADARTLLARHRGDTDAVVLTEPRELPHLREIARLAGVRAIGLPLPVDRSLANQQLAEFRDQVRETLRSEDLTAQMLVLEPLFEEASAAEVAAAVTALLRRRPAPTAAPAGREAPPVPQARAAEPGPAPVTWARLFVGIGSRDDVRPGDLVGALAGEAGIPGSRIGKIEIRDSFSLVEVQAEFADRVIQAVNGTTIKGRSVRADYDRGGSERPQRRAGAGGGPGGPGAGRGGPPRRRLDRRPPTE